IACLCACKNSVVRRLAHRCSDWLDPLSHFRVRKPLLPGFPWLLLYPAPGGFLVKSPIGVETCIGSGLRTETQDQLILALLKNHADVSVLTREATGHPIPIIRIAQSAKKRFSGFRFKPSQIFLIRRLR